MSSLSTGLNSIAAVVLEDWVRSMAGWTLTEKQTRWALRGIVVAVGAINLALMFVVEHLGMVMQVRKVSSTKESDIGSSKSVLNKAPWFSNGSLSCGVSMSDSFYVLSSLK